MYDRSAARTPLQIGIDRSVLLGRQQCTECSAHRPPTDRKQPMTLDAVWPTVVWPWMGRSWYTGRHVATGIWPVYPGCTAGVHGRRGTQPGTPHGPYRSEWSNTAISHQTAQFGTVRAITLCFTHGFTPFCTNCLVLHGIDQRPKVHHGSQPASPYFYMRINEAFLPDCPNLAGMINNVPNPTTYSR